MIHILREYGCIAILLAQKLDHDDVDGKIKLTGALGFLDLERYYRLLSQLGSVMLRLQSKNQVTKEFEFEAARIRKVLTEAGRKAEFKSRSPFLISLDRRYLLDVLRFVLSLLANSHCCC